MTQSLIVESIDWKSIDRNQAAEVADLLCRVWPKPGRTVEGRTNTLLTDFAQPENASGPCRQAWLIRLDGVLAAYAEITPRWVRDDRGEHLVAGLARVCCDPAFRGRGLGEAIVRAAWETVDSGEYEWSLFQTSHAVRPFYERLGATVVTNRVVNSRADDPDANPFWDEVVMRYPASAEDCEGVLDLLGPGF